MKKNQKAKEIQNLFEGGDIDYIALNNFLQRGKIQIL